jgi:hypothetical protein
MRDTNEQTEQSQEQDPAWLKDCTHASAGNGPKPVFVIAYIKRHFMKISAKLRGGKFTQVSSEALNSVEVALEAKLKELMREVPDPLGQCEPDEVFLTGYGKEKVLAAFNVWLAREMHRQTRLVRTGKTL